ncbi:hypothetical protein SOCE26_055070 [Sorangium cellulosum]|uniref:DUF4340 domain-containing protein n=1 Tax=Sorangium cellulosum TaxID=56 RepID=A0A2L0EXM1_SORCE|nr:DUF4340 domain-containing protein [Sorangium cellulosum]AUX44047.1 hypothetical protein SOCE26_055070 [Sorangium cellulosum]
MRLDRSFFVHLGLLVAAALFATLVWTRDKKAAALAVADVTVWAGRAEDVESITFEGKSKKVTLEARKDKEGRYFVGTTERKATPPAEKPKDDVHGAGDDHDHDEAPAEPEPAVKTTTFVSVGAGNKLAEALAPLKALRAVGRIPDDRASEFGLSEPEGTLTIKVRGAERKLVLGAATPGGSDRYARDEATGEVYAIKGDIYRDLDTAESRLLERDLHEWKDVDVARARVIVADKRREVVRGGDEGKKFWADPASPEQNDETVGNWMSKLDRLRPTEYVATLPEQKDVVVRVEYAGRSGDLGFLELVKGPPGASGKPDYFLVTERTRLHGKVPSGLAEQVEQDVGAVVK